MDSQMDIDFQDPGIEVVIGLPITAQTHSQPTRDQWEEHKEQILELNSKHELSEVRRLMAERDFRASIKSYRDHLRKWGANNKNLRQDVVDAIVRKRNHRRSLGKQSIIRYKGRTVKDSQIDRYVGRRKKIYTDQYLFESVIFGPPSPKDLEMFSPPPSPRALSSPDNFRSIEITCQSISMLVSDYVAGRKLGLADINDPRNRARYQLSTEIQNYQFSMVPRAKDPRPRFDILYYLSDFRKCFRGLIQREDPNKSTDILEILSIMGDSIAPYLGPFLKQATSACERTLGASHPISILCGQLVQGTSQGLKPYLQGCIRAIINMCDAEYQWDWWGIFAVSSLYRGISSKREALAKSEQYCKDSLGIPNLSSSVRFRIQFQYAIHLERNGSYQLAEELCHNLLRLYPKSRFRCYSLIASCRAEHSHSLEAHYAAIEYWWLAIHSANKNHWTRGSLAYTIERLLFWQTKWGYSDAASVLYEASMLAQKVAGMDNIFEYPDSDLELKYTEKTN